MCSREQMEMFSDICPRKIGDCRCFVLACLFPFGAWLFRILDHFSLLLSFICSTSIVLNLYTLFLIIQQILLVYHGQTWYEYGKNIRIYANEKDFQANLQQIFGKRWYCILFSPLISSLPMGDGMTFDNQHFGAKQS